MTYNKIQESVAHIRDLGGTTARFGIILGTGLGNLIKDINVEIEIPYKDIPHFPLSTVQSHAGKLVFGHLSGQKVVVMCGRFHYYEGYSVRELTFPVRVLKYLGIERLFISNVAGSTNPEIKAGDLVFIRDHINLQPENPLRGDNDDRLGPRFPDMLHTYDRQLNALALDIAQRHEIRAREGVYVALQGPNLETPAEYLFLHRIGGDLVGMSTVPEVLVARHMGLPVFVVSVVSNQCFPIETLTPTTVEEVIAVAEHAEPKMRFIVKKLLELIS